ncbi:unnamed protein product [Didymodactylos carnosus]|uniref:G-protein coupled receptors family 1 profile domain-containing protein n=1 Tax=Didymodactylos carnosus TaxID=1234261 RepID=A0A813Y6Y9_9BILA|nr:unnamed protein product [Didymodactylos carnosus]CAF0927117.1 unnamed protein product [Didymodactylos carnosus]CAF3664790.1 unnamed protein product [Didymodactylos carnosus]CAF3704058.1 unnamed protein product [Didymodactylos carnosus]
MRSVIINLIVLIWSLMMDGYVISENRGIKSGLVYCEIQSWVLPLYSFFTLIGIIIASFQICILTFCCGCRKPEQCLKVRSYVIDIIWAFFKEVPQIIILLDLNLCRDGWFKRSSLAKAIFSICVTLWKLYNMYTFLTTDTNSDDIPIWCRTKRLYYCFPISLMPIWTVNLIVSIMIAVIFINRPRGPGDINIPGAIRTLHVNDIYLYEKYINRSGIYLKWPYNKNVKYYMKLIEIDHVMANYKIKVHLSFGNMINNNNKSAICFERSLFDLTPPRCFSLIDNNTLEIVSTIDVIERKNATFTFIYREQRNQYNIGNIIYSGELSNNNLFLDKLLYFRLKQYNAQNDDDFLMRINNYVNISSINQLYEFYTIGKYLIPIEKEWRYGVGKCKPCVLGPKKDY